MFSVSVELNLAPARHAGGAPTLNNKTTHHNELDPVDITFEVHIEIPLALAYYAALLKHLGCYGVFQVEDFKTCFQAPNSCPSPIDNDGSSSQTEFVKLVLQHIAKNVEPFELCEQGVGGTYFVLDANSHKVAVFKPVDEEPGAVNNPKKLVDEPLLPPGGGAIREVAAYLLDHQGRARVPETCLLSNLHHRYWTSPDGTTVSKSGSIQAFVENAGDLTSMGASLFSVEDVHNVGILDVRLFNMDRNGENLLAVPVGGSQKQEFRLVPIDHAYILPNKLDNAFFEWLTWKQAKVPFSAETLAYISDLDIEADCRTLDSLGIPSDCIRTYILCTTVLKKGAAAGLTLYEIATLVSRKNPSQESELEKIVSRAEESKAFFREFEKLVDEAVSRRASDKI